MAGIREITLEVPSSSVRVFRTAHDTEDRLKELPPINFKPFTLTQKDCLIERFRQDGMWEKQIKHLESLDEGEELTLAMQSFLSDEQIGTYREMLSKIGSMVIDTRATFQEFIGFGGAFTEASAVNYYKMSPDVQKEIIKAYFDPKEGNAYSLCRTHINSCDFGLGNYAYTEVDGDTEFKHFSIDRDRQKIIPMIKEAQKVAGHPLTIFASPWSPPAWMKTNGMMNQGGKLKPEYREAWARYYCRYIREYEKEGINIWGLTVQNEPAATQTWDSCVYTAEEERDFVRDYLGPTLEKEGLSDIKVIVWDHNRDEMFDRAYTILSDPEAAKYVWGTGFHWYEGDYFNGVQYLHDVFPDKQLIFTEGCQEGGPHLGSWDLGVRYARSIINDLNHWTVGWVDWNLVLDETGGPNHVGNLCSAPIIVNTKTGELSYQSSYYYMGHFSRFIQPGAKRIFCSKMYYHLEATAFLNPNGQVCVVVMNDNDKKWPFIIRYKGGGAKTNILPHSIYTFIFDAE